VATEKNVTYEISVYSKIKKTFTQIRALRMCRSLFLMIYDRPQNLCLWWL